MSTLARSLAIVTALGVMGAAHATLSAAGQDAAAIEKGKAVYAAQKCSMCHSIGGKGGKSSALDGVGKKLTADEIKAWIVTPTEMTKKANSTKKPPMPNKYGKLPAADIDALVAYMASLK